MKTTVRELSTRHAPQQVWDLLVDPRRGPFWSAEWAGKLRYSLKLERRAWRQPSAGAAGLVFEQAETEPPRRLVLSAAGTRRVVWTFETEPREEGALLRFTSDADESFSLASLLGGLTPEKAAAQVFEDLAARLG